MKVLISVLFVILLVTCAYAVDQKQARAPERVIQPRLGFEFYCQPPHVNLWTINASTGFASEASDDIPDTFAGMTLHDVSFYVSEWGGTWIDPDGVYINFYNAECPPGMTSMTSFFIAWGDMQKTVVYDSPGSFTCYRCTADLPSPLVILTDMSIGFQVVNEWGDAAPYCGVVMTDENVVFGDCSGYWDGLYWGYPRWSGLDVITGVPIDLAYCLSDGTGGDAHLIFDNCYVDGGLITIYDFYAHAGNAPVNDIELCAFIDGQPADVVQCSVPGSWSCHFDPGTNCVYYQTADNTIPPNETYGLFDVRVRPPYCFESLMVVWTFTYNGQVVAGPDTTFFACGPSANQPTTWGAVKALYK
ncbi:MAG TPA: hypothetical protein VMU02_08180 [bacterium]|nr:hypothetical protein [bacterium]